MLCGPSRRSHPLFEVFCIFSPHLAHIDVNVHPHKHICANRACLFSSALLFSMDFSLPKTHTLQIHTRFLSHTRHGFVGKNLWVQHQLKLNPVVRSSCISLTHIPWSQFCRVFFSGLLRSLGTKSYQPALCLMEGKKGPAKAAYH